ncbi:hypothetical protein K7432_016066 [Basidiobolus ranarum]|uniref:Uncharacterized protein n=1 Tax=Basidiobolus ranarum TaxID=34480 RepID=A0ABR2WF81_9FUNG
MPTLAIPTERNQFVLTASHDIWGCKKARPCGDNHPDTFKSVPAARQFGNKVWRFIVGGILGNGNTHI